MILRASILALVCTGVAACTNGTSEGISGLPGLAAPYPALTKVLYTPWRTQPAIHAAIARARIPVRRQPRIVTPPHPLQCVPFAREFSDIKIRGDAWTWWRQARGRYGRNRLPAVGAVLVLNSRGRSRGHVAVVAQILNDREIVVSHANWLNNGRIHLDTPVRDVSPGNDWSAVRVWYIPGDRYGAGVYPAQGFIHPTVTTASR